MAAAHGRTLDGSMPAAPRHGRRLIQMLFRANQDAAAADARWEDHSALPSSHSSQQQSSPRSPPHPELLGSQPPPSSKFSALKRKLFPSTQRRAPVRVPALLPLSPISTGTTMASPLDQVQPQQADSRHSDIGRKVEGNEGEGGGNELHELHEDQPVDSWPTDALEEMKAKSAKGKSARPDYDSDEDDRDLELAVEALDYESSNAEETLAAMSRAIDHVREWKHAQEHRTLQLMAQMEQDAASSPATDLESSDVDESVETMVTAFHQEQERRWLDLRRDASDSRTAEPCAPLCSALGEEDAARIAEALSTDRSGEEGLALARLRDELFQLDVRERHAQMQAALLQELEGAETDLDLKIVDVEAYTSDLDSVLAQFDAADTSDP